MVSCKIINNNCFIQDNLKDATYSYSNTGPEGGLDAMMQIAVCKVGDLICDVLCLCYKFLSGPPG